MPPTLYMSVCVLVLFSIRSGGLSVASDKSIAIVACVAHSSSDSVVAHDQSSLNSVSNPIVHILFTKQRL
jgi:hypothetical protein